MDVIRHNYIPSNRDIKLFATSKRILAKCFVCDDQTIDFAAVDGADCYKVKRWRVGLKNLSKSRRAILDHKIIVDATLSAEMFRHVRATRPPLHRDCHAQERRVGLYWHNITVREVSWKQKKFSR
jgi:hypothetical protein